MMRSARTCLTLLLGCVMGTILTTLAFFTFADSLASHSNRVHCRLDLSPKTIFSTLARDDGRGGVGSPHSLVEEYQVRKLLLPVVYTSRGQLVETVQTVGETWGKASPRFVVVVGGRERLSSQTELNGVALHAEQCTDFPADGDMSEDQLFCLLEFVRDTFIADFHWFVFVSHRSYVAVSELERVLVRLDPQIPAYVGRPVTPLPSSPPTHCEEGPGLILSHIALEAIAAALPGCSTDTAGSGDGLSGDVELGRCFSRQLGVQCSSSEEALRSFVSDADVSSSNPDRLWYGPAYQDMLTLHPITSPTHMRSVHLFVKHRESQFFRKRVQILTDIVDGMCRSLPRGKGAPVTELSAYTCNTTKASDTACSSNTRAKVTTELLPKPFLPQDKSEVTPWQSLRDATLYISSSVQPATELGGELDQELSYVVKKAVERINMQEEEAVKLQGVDSGFLRYRGSQGREYALNLLLFNKHGTFKRRVEVLRPHQPELIFQPLPFSAASVQVVNFVVPLSHVTERFTEFLKMYERICLALSESCRLVLSVFGDEDLRHIKESVALLGARYPSGLFKIVSSNEAFSRARALHLGLSALNSTDLAFLCDVDMTIVDASFLQNCRQNTLRGQRVYYPEFFKYYNMDYAYRFKRKPSLLPIKRRHGHWATYSYGMACLYKSDYDRTPGFDTSIVGWGEEDVDLFSKLLQTGIEVLKAPEPLLFHRYHEKVCSKSLGPVQLSHCASSRSEGLADRMELAVYVFYLEEKCGISKRPLWS